MKHRHALDRDETGMRTDEAGVKTGVDERPAEAKHTGPLTDDGREFVDVGVREHRHDGVESASPYRSRGRDTLPSPFRADGR